MTPTDRLMSALRPVREALTQAGHRDWEQALAEARATASAAMAEAEAQARRITAEAIQQGRAGADAYRAAQRSRNAIEARAMRLRAERDNYEELRSATRAATFALRDAPDYPDQRGLLCTVVTRVLGADATFADSADGGVVGATKGRRLDLSFSALADQALDEVLNELAEDRPT